DVSRIIFSGSEDAVGIRTRSELAKNIALEALQDHDKEKGLTLASIGCGSALPVARTVQALVDQGYKIEKLHLVDMDPMALATAVSILRQRGVDPSIIQLHPETIGIINGKTVSGIEPESVDLVDAWGFLEYFKPISAR